MTDNPAANNLTWGELRERIPVRERWLMSKTRSIRGAAMAGGCLATGLFGIGAGCSPRSLISQFVVDGVTSAVSDSVFTLLDFILPVIPPV